MEHDTGKLEVVGVNGIEFVDDGTTLIFDIVDSIPPYSTSLLSFKGVVVTKLYQIGHDEFPLTIVDLTWNSIYGDDMSNILEKHGYPFFNESNNIKCMASKLVLSHFEGDLVGDVIAESIDVQRTD